PGHTGAPGEPTCHACHNDLQLNEPGGRLEVVDFPEEYTGGQAYVVSLVLNSDEMATSGFQAAVSGGSLIPVDDKTVVLSDSVGRKYIGHSPQGANPMTPSRMLWTFEWIAPSEAGAGVSLSAAANSGNGDNSPMGDFIYTVQAQSR
ncbi:MAG: choice-of-anchor V domain-containing protein, partial [Longimicrobiales bacterium]